MDKIDKIVRDFRRSLDAKDKKGTSPYEIIGDVTRVNGKTAWVHLPNGVEETPVELTVSAKKGDKVKVSIQHRNAYIIGNITSPPTDDTKANEAHTKAVVAQDTAVVAQDTAVVAQDTAVVAQGTAVNAKETAESILIYDHDYTVETIDEHIIANFQAHLYRGGVDIHTSYDPSLFTWYMKTEDGTDYLGSGYTISIDTTNCGYGAEVIGKFTTTDDAEALTQDGSNLTDIDGENLTVRSTGDSVRVRDLTVTTEIYPQEKLMVVGAEDEHLVTIQTLAQYILESETHILYCGTSTELV